jgi:hypothetical protein
MVNTITMIIHNKTNTLFSKFETQCAKELGVLSGWAEINLSKEEFEELLIEEREESQG